MKDRVSSPLNGTTVGSEKRESLADIFEVFNGDGCDQAPQVLNSYIPRLVECGCGVCNRLDKYR